MFTLIVHNYLHYEHISLLLIFVTTCLFLSVLMLLFHTLLCCPSLLPPIQYFVFHSKLDGWVHLIDMFQKVLFMFFHLDCHPHISAKAWEVVAVLRGVLSKCSMYRLATIGLTGEPLAAPSSCSWNWPLKEK